MVTEIVSQAWYRSMVEDCRSMIVEAEFNAKYELIVGWWSVGKRIVEDKSYQRYRGGNAKILQGLANDIGRSYRSVAAAIQFYRKFPDPEQWPFGKNMTWTRITRDFLPDSVSVLDPFFKEIRRRYPDWAWTTAYKMLGMNGGRERAEYHLREYIRLVDKK